MRKCILLAAAASLLSTPAFARDGAGYIGADFGAMKVDDMRFDLRNGGARVADLDFRYGYDGSIFAGYDMGAFRVELEGSYKRARVDELTSTYRLPGEGLTFANPRVASGNVTSLSGMVNGLFDFGDDDGISGFVGGGAGLARVSVKDVAVFANQAAAIDDRHTRFAWQLLAGVRQAISPNVDVHVRYRFFNVPNLRLGVSGAQGTAALAVQDTSARLRTHSLLGGVTFNLGGRPAPIPAAAPLPPAPLPPAPVQRPATQTCPDGSVIPATSYCPLPPPAPATPPRRAGERG